MWPSCTRFNPVMITGSVLTIAGWGFGVDGGGAGLLPHRNRGLSPAPLILPIAALPFVLAVPSNAAESELRTAHGSTPRFSGALSEIVPSVMVGRVRNFTKVATEFHAT